MFSRLILGDNYICIIVHRGWLIEVCLALSLCVTVRNLFDFKSLNDK